MRTPNLIEKSVIHEVMNMTRGIGTLARRGFASPGASGGPFLPSGSPNVTLNIINFTAYVSFHIYRFSYIPFNVHASFSSLQLLTSY
jgi:hypothetical protein